MIRAAALTDTVTLFNEDEGEGTTNIYGDPVPVEDDGVEVRAKVSPIDTTEDEVGRDVRLNRYMVITEPLAPVDGLSRVEWLGSSYEVKGEPKKLTHRNGLHHLEIEMQGVQG